MKKTIAIIGSSGAIGNEFTRRLSQLHPGTVDSDLSKPFQGHVPEGDLFTAVLAVNKMIEVLGSTLLGTVLRLSLNKQKAGVI